jgi:hypothetical protein
MKKEKFLLLALALSILILSNASAEILFSQPKSLYNVGDSFDISITLKSSVDTSNFLTADLVCGTKTLEIYKSPVSIKQGEEKAFSISTVLGNFLISGVNGECHVNANFGDENSQSQTFEVTDNVKVVLNVPGAIFNPGDTVQLKGTATKLNTENLNGFVEISIPDMNFSFIGAVSDGAYNTSFVISSNAKAGTYEIIVTAYDKDSSGAIMNQGETTSTFKVKQLMKNLDIAIDAASIMPEKEISFTVLAYDQAGDYINTEASTSIITSTGLEKKSFVLKTGETSKYLIETSFEPGSWKIKAKSGDLEVQKEFFVEELKKIDFSLENNSLTVKNNGNIPYTGFVEVSIGGITQVKPLDALGVGQTKTFKLAAPNGQYEIQVTDGNQKVSLGTAFLTGRAISVSDTAQTLASNWWILAWFLIIIVLIVAALLIYKKVAKKKFIGKASGAFTPSTKSKPTGFSEKSIATQAGVLNKGTKQECAIISLCIKNLEDLQTANSDGLKTVDSALWQAKESGAKIYTDGRFRVAVLAPTLAKQETEIPLAGARIAEQIERIISEYNKRSAQKVDFGIAVNLGELIYESVGGKLKFISPDNSVAQTKKISQFPNKEVVLSSKVHAKTLSKLKSIKLQDRELWKLEKITDRTAHIDFINRFKESQKKPY